MQANRESVEREEQTIAAWLRALDEPMPDIAIEAVLARARRPAIAPAGRLLLRWAMAAAIALGAFGIAYALPGSPVRAWVAAVVERVRGAAPPLRPSRVEPAPESSPSPAPGAATNPAGVAVDPGSSLTVVFESLAAGAHVGITPSDGEEVVVRAPSGAATYSLEGERLVVRCRDEKATFEVEIPRLAPRVEVIARGLRVHLHEAGRDTQR